MSKGSLNDEAWVKHEGRFGWGGGTDERREGVRKGERVKEVVGTDLKSSYHLGLPEYTPYPMVHH